MRGKCRREHQYAHLRSALARCRISRYSYAATQGYAPIDRKNLRRARRQLHRECSAPRTDLDDGVPRGDGERIRDATEDAWVREEVLPEPFAGVRVSIGHVRAG